MTAKRFNIKPQDDYFGIVDNYSADKICVINGIRTEIEAEWLCKDMNTLNDENEQLQHDATILIQSNQDYRKENEQLKQLIRKLEKQIHLVHMSSMFSTVKSFKGDVSKRYKYSEETDTIYDTVNTYGQYNKILDKKEVVMLLNEYETLLEGDKK